MRTQGRFLFGISAVFGLLLTARVWKSTKTFPVQRRGAGATQVPSLGSDAYMNQIPEALKERWKQAQGRLTSGIADLATKLLSLQESEERWALSFNENQRSLAADLRRLRRLVTWTVILSCFGVVSFAIVLFLAYVRY